MFKRKVSITRIKKDKKEDLQDTVLIESPVDILINSEPIANIICLRKDLTELAFGFLFSIGIINSVDDIKEIKTSELDNNILITLQDSIDLKFDEFNMNPVSRVVDTTCGIPSPWREVRKKSVDKANTKGKIIGTFVETPEDFKIWKDLGVLYLSYKVDVGILYDACQITLKGLKSL